MYLIVGLGNPGKKYEMTRHNVGFDTIDVLIERWRIAQGGTKFHAMYGKGTVAGEKVILAKPLTFMNLSGSAVRGLADYFKIDPAKELIVIHDDVDLEPGRIRIRPKGSAGGHNGLKDIIAKLGMQDFTRIKIGVGAKPQGWDLADYVLSRFSRSDRKLVDEAVERAADAAETILSDSADKAMNLYN